jgi:hypothetical protein
MKRSRLSADDAVAECLDVLKPPHIFPRLRSAFRARINAAGVMLPR